MNYKFWSIIVILIAIVVRISISMFAVPSGDSVMHSNVAIFIHQNWKIPVTESLGRLDTFWSPPLFHIIGAIMMYVLPLKVLPSLFGGLALVVFYFVCSKIMDDKKTFWSVLFLSFIPISIYYSTIFFTDIALMFFCILIVWSAYKQNVVWTGIFCGLGMLTKYNVVFIFPLALWLLFRRIDEEKKFKTIILNFCLWGLLVFCISEIWYVRNFFYFGNPFYHFFNGIFTQLGFKVYDMPFIQEHITHSIMEIFDWHWYWAWFLDLFGVPLGRFANLMFMPFKPWSLILWFWAVIIFFAPIITGLKVKKSAFINTFLVLWIVPFVLQMFLFVKDLGYNLVFFRYFLPSIPALAILWGYGVDKIIKNLKGYYFIGHYLVTTFVVMILIICSGFVVGEVVKVHTASERINQYQVDFDYIIDNTKVDSVVYPTGFSYYVERKSLPLDMKLDNLSIYYVEIPALFDKGGMLNVTDGFKLMYYNNVTGTRIYQITNTTGVDLYNKND